MAVTKSLISFLFYTFQGKQPQSLDQEQDQIHLGDCSLTGAQNDPVPGLGLQPSVDSESNFVDRGEMHN